MSRLSADFAVVEAGGEGGKARGLAALSLKLDAEEVARLEKPYQPKPVLDHL